MQFRDPPSVLRYPGNLWFAQNYLYVSDSKRYSFRYEKI